MLVTMLTMIFNQSSMAWNTGVASVTDLETVRKKIGASHDIADDVLPGIGQTGVRDIGDSGREIKYRTVSLFKNWNGNGQLQASDPSENCSGRAFDQINWGKEELTELTSYGNQDAWSGKKTDSFGSGIKGQNTGIGVGGYVVGVKSAGPDRKWNTDDDINTFPEDIQ